MPSELSCLPYFYSSSPIQCRHLSPIVLLSFPTRRSSDLRDRLSPVPGGGRRAGGRHRLNRRLLHRVLRTDRKSTRLNSSHVAISYAVFCLKKKKIYYYNFK